MISPEGKVVVIVTMSTDHLEEMGLWIARIEKLGITSYKQTKAEAVQLAKEMFAERVQVHRKRAISRLG